MTTDLALPVVVLLVGLLVGYLVGRVVAGARASTQVQLAQARLEAEQATNEERLKAERAAADERLRVERAAADELLRSERDAAQQRLDDLREAQADLETRLVALSRQALSENSERLLALAAERFTQQREAAEHDLSQRQKAIETLVAPLQQSLTKVHDQISLVERSRTEAYAALREQVSAMRESSDLLRGETRQLVTALRAPQVRGRWGEHQLRRVVEVAGMVEHCDFSEQQTVRTPDGEALRPDLVVHLSGGRNVVVDAKVAFGGYLEAMEARDDTVRAERLKAHARHVKTHIDALAGKQYWEHLEPAPDFVVMFVPAEVFLNAALEEDPTLLEYAFERNVVVATPATLVAMLRTIAYSWRQEALAANAREVYALGKELHARLATMGGHMTTLGKELKSAVDAYNKTVSSLESRVLVQARRFTELKVSDQELASPAQIEIAPRTVQAEELVEWDAATVVTLGAEGRQRAVGS